MRGRGARNGFSPRETLSPIFTSTPQRTPLLNVPINPRCFSETQAAAFVSCFCRRDRLPKQIQTRNKLSGKYRNLRAHFTVDARLLSRHVRGKGKRNSSCNLSQKELVTGSPGGELFFCFEPLLLKSQSRTVFNALYFSSLHICPIRAPRTQSICLFVILAMPLFCAVLRVSITFDTYNSTV